MKTQELRCSTLKPWIGTKSYQHQSLLIELKDRLILVDPGIGLRDHLEPEKRLGWFYSKWMRAELNPDHTAFRNLERLGYTPREVTDIILTHLDSDQASGIADFPSSRVHVFGPEYVAAMAPATWIEKIRYRAHEYGRSSAWTIHTQEKMIRWKGLKALHPLEGLPEGIYLIPTIGHTLGHCCVGLDTSDGKGLLYAGDAIFSLRELQGRAPRSPSLNWMIGTTQIDRESRVHQVVKLRQFHRQNPDIKIIPSKLEK